jgi:hypothetical protein
VDPNLPAVTALAPESRSTSKAEVPPTPLELRVGKAVAMTASAIAAGVQDYASNGGMAVSTKVRVAELFGELYELRCLMLPAWDFDGIAHQRGRETLIELCGGVSEAEQAIVDTLINTVVLILRKVARAQTN